MALVKLEKLTKEEVIYGPRDKQRLEQMSEGGEFLSDLIGKGSKDDDTNVSFVSYNSPLWKASLEVLSSFPLANVDAKSGLIITDWYTSEKKPSERFKITVLLMSSDIRADSVKVSVHKQIIKKIDGSTEILIVKSQLQLKDKLFKEQ